MARPRRQRSIDDRLRKYLHALELRATGRHDIDVNPAIDAALRAMLRDPEWLASTRVLLEAATSNRPYRDIAVDAEQLGLQPPGPRAPWSEKTAERAANAAREELQRRLRPPGRAAA